MKKPNLTIITPWLSKSDWTGLIFARLIENAKKNNLAFNTIVGSRFHKKKIQKQGPFSFLYPKLKVVDKMIYFAHKNMLADRIIIIDSSFVNMKAIRYIAGRDRFISCFVNGGFFQEYDLDRQSISGYNAELKKFEEGHYALIDKIILPSKYALKIFIKFHPGLKNKSSYIYYPVTSSLNQNSTCFNKNGCLYASRRSFEKGYDIISTINKKNIKIDLIFGLNNANFRKKLTKYKSIIIPSRADLFGFCAVEAILEGTIPVVPAGLSYEELIDIPNYLKLSFPIGRKTKKEILTIVDKIDNLTEGQYKKIISKAQDSLFRIMRDRNHNFSAAFKSIMHEKK
ncbi:MAG: hypothetical protein PHS45_02405 [Bacilli bacterium]|nr:hypothetical protein [Bacilli bacterium]